jgi:sugar phosphate isomerase/epimerase
MKLSIVIADRHALPSAFVVFRGFKEFIPKAAQYGYQGIELALKRVNEIDRRLLQQLLDDNGLEVSSISTGQVYADGGLMLTHDDKRKREEVKAVFREFIDLAADFGRTVNIGRVRGPVGNRSRAAVEDLFVEVARDLCSYALPRNVTLILEPVNRYEIDFVNSVSEGVKLIEKVGMDNMKLMPDLFHMNIEDSDMGRELADNVDLVHYVHVADSNRLAPGWGHTDFAGIFKSLLYAGYDGWVSAEILPDPDPGSAARQAVEFMTPLIRDYNEKIINQNKYSMR